MGPPVAGRPNHPFRSVVETVLKIATRSPSTRTFEISIAKSENVENSVSHVAAMPARPLTSPKTGLTATASSAYDSTSRAMSRRRAASTTCCTSASAFSRDIDPDPAATHVGDLDLSDYRLGHLLRCGRPA